MREKKFWREIGAGPMGTLIKAPTAVSPANRAIKIISLELILIKNTSSPYGFANDDEDT
ncbi:hypothetical protein [Dethiosulfovibrio salsuginis]|uniref:hypothetical protein n=1 Tax=Dethiosulfovibrio salsuginis TaxID=561720 RepID=UPI001F25B909|nr:hypothetical protein [Dethiosulfovibrio salsuginis]